MLKGECSEGLDCAVVGSREEMGILLLFPGFYLNGFGACRSLGCRCSWSGRWQLAGMLNARKAGRERGRSWLGHQEMQLNICRDFFPQDFPRFLQCLKNSSWSGQVLHSRNL